MLLPSGYQDSNKYFQDALNFLKKHSWLFNFAVTNLLVQDVLNKLPDDWARALLSLSNSELNELPCGLIKECWPQSLQDFCNSCQSLRLPVVHLHDLCSPDYDLPKSLSCGLSQKKQHEVCHLAALIHKECLLYGITKILDVGSGLGYLGQVLHDRFGYRVLGLESNPHHVEVARKRQSDLHSPDNTVSYVTCEVSPVSEQAIWKAMKEKFSTEEGDDIEMSPVCLVGLHACGDLSAIAAQLFLNHLAIRLFIVLPCCYHKMTRITKNHDQQEDESTWESFTYFPHSNSLKRHMTENFTDAKMFLRHPFLRLASQETCIRWKHCTNAEHEEHSTHLMARAVLYLYAHNEGITLKKKCRRGVRKTQLNNFDMILDDILLRYNFIPKDGSVPSSNARQEMVALWNKFSGFRRLAEVLTGLQVTLQFAVESFVLIDKMVYLQENKCNLLSYNVIKVMDDEISPRCHALVARK